MVCTHYISLHQVAVRKNVTIANDRAFETSIMYKTTLPIVKNLNYEIIRKLIKLSQQGLVVNILQKTVILIFKRFD